MADFPSPFYVQLKGGGYLTVTGAKIETQTDNGNFDGSNYRDEPPVLPAISSGELNTATSGVTGSGVTSAPTLPGGGVLISSTSSVLQSDSYAHVAPRNQSFKRTMLQWWDLSGAAFVFTGTTTIGSVTITTASTAGLYPGAAISGTGIPASAVIRTVGTVSFTISIAATANGSVPLTLAVGLGNLVGECWLDRFVGWSGGIPKRF